ncbi:uncharacterized protein G2W53_004355 [Senna tora]|uniref:Uncharacterized protein n=1 Tax=Senna tora TaxID=362788 RepID=A0A835CK45_9FABA|nr:uncharacterized protein G2W53_004355 [Senna tora]
MTHLPSNPKPRLSIKFTQIRKYNAKRLF